MTATFTRRIPDVYVSVYRFLKDTQYTIASTTATLEGHHGAVGGFPGLVVIPGFPDDYFKLERPTLGLVEEDETSSGGLFGVPRSLEDVFRFVAYGFVCRRGTDQQHRTYRDAVRNDLRELLEHAQDEGFDLLDHESKDEIGDLEVVRAEGRLIQPTIPGIEVDRYRFLVEFDVAYA